MKINPIIKNPYILFSPFLISFIIWVIISPPNGTSGDEARYLGCAQNMIHGFYSPPAPNIELTNGPGYPILLIPFVALKLPLISITLMNAFFYYFSIVLLFKALKEIVTPVVATTFSLLWAFYFIAYQSITFIHTETFTYLLVTFLALTILKAFRNNTNALIVRKYVILSGVILGYLVLTKMILGYVLLIMLIGSGLFWLLNRQNLNFRKGAFIILVALATTSPYLLYTYQLTGKVFYWGTGSDTLYWMSSTSSNEFGSWFPDREMETDPNFFTNYIPGCKDSIILHHGAELEVIHKLKGIEQDDAYKDLAIRNIKAHPFKYAQNLVYNTSRLLFQYPASYGIHRPVIMITFPINGILLTLILISLIPSLINWRKIPFSIRFLLVLVILYLCGSLLVTAYIRMFAIIVPLLLLWIAFIFQNTFRINLRFEDKP